MARRFHSNSGMARAPRRLTQWISKTVNFTDFTAAQTLQLMSFSQAELAGFVPCTLIRTVGMMVVAADTNFITNQIYSGAVGACLVRDDARAANAIPDPFDEASDDVWFWHQFFAAVIDDRADSDLVVSQNFVVDSKAQRKIVDGDAIVFSGQGGGEADGFDVALYLRVLLKLH